MTERFGECQQILTTVAANMRRVIVGKDATLQQVLICWMAGGHILIEDVPGTGKTILARALAKSVKVDFKRVQFTPDLLPADIVGSAIFNQSKAAFEFIKGPLFTTLLLGDEINRATPRTQSALLEAMAENQVTAEGVTWPLSPSFMVIATQNPVEQHGTFPLPEAQLDRFMMKISMGYPRIEDEIAILKGQNVAHPIHALQPVVSEDHIKLVKSQVPLVKVSDAIYQYVAKIIAATRRSPELKLAASFRATHSLVRGAQVLALMEGSAYVTPSHVAQLILPIVAHRLALTPEARLAGRTAAVVLEQIVKEVSVPVGSTAQPPHAPA